MDVELSTPSAVAPGLRERNKLDKLRRIKEAARELFIAKGFDDATTREIALRAGVGMGTVYLYADDKRDLLFLIANDELEALSTKAAAGFRPEAPVLRNLMRAFELHYAHFGAEPDLARLQLREMTFYDAGQQAQRFQATRERVIGLIETIVAAGQSTGNIKQTEDARLIAWVAFCIYQVELRRWLAADNPDLAAGSRRLEKALTLLLAGAATPAKTEQGRRSTRDRRPAPDPARAEPAGKVAAKPRLPPRPRRS